MKTYRNISYPGMIIHETNLMKGGADLVIPPHTFIAADYQKFYGDSILQHAFGHILQFKKYGFFKYYFRIGLLSIAATIQRNDFAPVEIEANRLAHEFFGTASLMGGKFFPLQ